MSITYPKSSRAKLTICTVSFCHKRHLELNWNLTEMLNSINQYRWIVVENTPNGEQMILGREDGNVLVLKGAPGENVNNPNEHHAAGLHKALEYVDTRFVLILDPDFYIVRPNWVVDILSYMKANNLSLFGVPWHPKWHTKYRYFPCIHCVFVDLKKIPISTLDFMPDFMPFESASIQRRLRNNFLTAKLRSNVPSVFRNVINLLKFMTIERRQIGWDGDTGAGLYTHFYQKGGHRYECAVPVFRPRSDIQIPIPEGINSKIEKMLPDHLCYIPKQPGYFSRSGFLGGDTITAEWEEFLWQNRLLGFHVRGYPKRKARNIGSEVQRIEQTLDNLIK